MQNAKVKKDKKASLAMTVQVIKFGFERETIKGILERWNNGIMEESQTLNLITEKKEHLKN